MKQQDIKFYFLTFFLVSISSIVNLYNVLNLDYSKYDNDIIIFIFISLVVNIILWFISMDKITTYINSKEE